MGDLDLEALDLLGELDPLGVGQGPSLVVDVANVEHLAHEIDHCGKRKSG